MKSSHKLLILVGLALAAGPLGTTSAYADLISSDFVLGPTSPGKWGSPVFGTGATVTWSLMSNGVSCAAEVAGCTISALSSFMPVGYLTEVQSAFDAWEAIADLTFVMVADDGAAFNAATTSGDIRLGGHAFDGPGMSLSHAFFPPANGLSAAGDIHFDVAESWKLGFGGPGFSVFQVAAHEIGHAIGLDHSADSAALMYAFYTEAFSGPQADDIAGAQFIYGQPQTPAVPEPGTMLLLGGGLLGLRLTRRRRG